MAAAESLQSCPTLCDPIDSSPPGFPVPGILQARILEWARNFWGRIKGAKYRFAFQDGTWDFSWDAVADKGPHLAMTREARGFSRVATDAEAPILCSPDAESQLTGNDPDAWND